MAKMVRNVSIVALVIIIVIAIIGALILNRALQDVGGEMGTITLTIDGKHANISADIDFKPSIAVGETDLEMRIDDSTVPVEYNGSSISATMGEDEFRSLLDRDSVNITGSVNIPFIAGLEIVKGLEEELDISFIHQMISTLNVSGVDINFSFTGYTEIFFLIDADVDRDFILNITDTPAKLISPAGSFNAKVIEMEFRTGEGGHARISMPALGALGLALYYRDVYIEAWGITAKITIPLFNG